MRGQSVEVEKPALKQQEQVEPPAFMSVAAGAELISVSEGMIRRLLERKQLKRYKLGTRTLLKASELLALVREE